MAIIRIDMVNGSPTGDGSDWGSNAMRDLPASLSDANSYRIKKSPAPVKVNSSGTFDWTSLSRVVQYSGSQVPGTINLVICDGSSGWTVATGSYVSIGNDTTYYKLGTEGGKSNNRATSFTIQNSPGTTTLLAYYDLGSSGIDLSSCERISFWMRVSATTTSNHYVIKLCSDQTGTTALETFTIPGCPEANTLYCWTLDKGSAFSSTPVKSVAIYTGSSSPSNGWVMTLDNIIAVTSSGVNLASLVSPGNVEQGATSASQVWYPVKAIWGSKIILDSSNNITAGSGPGYSGSTITGGDCYHRECLRPSLGDTSELNCAGLSITTSSVNLLTIGSSGSSTYIDISGGWENDSTQDGETWISGLSGKGNGLYINSKILLQIDKLCFSRVNCGTYLQCRNTKLGYIAVAGANTGYYMVGNSGYHSTNCVYDTLVSVNNYNYGVIVGDSGTYTIWSFCIKNIYTYGQASTSFGHAAIRFGAAAFFTLGMDDSGNMGEVVINNAYTPIHVNFANNPAIYNLTISNLIGSNYFYAGGPCYIKLYNPATFIATAPVIEPVIFQITKYNGSSIDDRIMVPSGEAVRQTSTVYGSNPYAWKVTPRLSSVSVPLPIGQVAVRSGKLVTVTCKIYRNNTGITAYIRRKGAHIYHVIEQSSAYSGSAGSWGDLTYTYTPSTDEIAEFDVLVTGGSSYELYVGQVDISQAS